MFFRDDHQPSIWPKLFLATLLTLALAASADILFGSRIDELPWSNPYRREGDFLRDGLLLACLAVYVVRVYATLFVFFRRILMWREALIVSSVMPWCLLLIAQAARPTDPVGWTEVAGIALYVAGSYLNSAGEYARHRFKSDPANRGRLYTEGLSARVRHVNYLGDVLLFSGLALVAHAFILLLIPWFMALLFLLVLAPLKERYLHAKYGEQFGAYAARSKMLIPYVI